MLVEYRPSWRRILAQIGRPLAAVFASSCAVTLLYKYGYHFRVFAVPDLPISVFGAAIGLLIGFRTNSGYDRWWEARTLWGGIVNQSRTWARLVATLPDQGDVASAYAREMIHIQIAWVHALKQHLRAQNPVPELAGLLPAATLERVRDLKNVPIGLLLIMANRTAEIFQLRLIGENRFMALQSILNDLTNLQGGCERIRNTPLPRQYSFWPDVFVHVYCFLLPLAIVEDLGAVTPFVTLVTGFAFLVVDRIGRNLEDPFHSLVYGIPLSSLCQTIETNLRQQLAEPIPPAIQPVGGVLE